VADKTEIAAVLLVPTQEYFDALLAQDLCGSRPPTAWRTQNIGACAGDPDRPDEWREGPIPDFCPAAEDGGSALVLGWAKAPVVEGCDRMEEVLRGSWDWGYGIREHSIRFWARRFFKADYRDTISEQERVRRALSFLSEYQIGAVVLLGVDGKEIS